MMRLAVAAAVACAALVALPDGGAAPAPVFRIVFAGLASQHFVDTKRYVADDDGSCFAREHTDETAHITWTAAAHDVTGAVSGSTVAGQTVRDSCGGSPENAPADWAQTVACNGRLGLVSPAVVTTTRTKT